MFKQTIDPILHLKALRRFVSLRRFLRDETGQDLIEYALAAALIALAAIATMRNLGSQVAAGYTHIATSLSSQL